MPLINGDARGATPGQGLGKSLQRVCYLTTSLLVCFCGRPNSWSLCICAQCMFIHFCHISTNSASRRCKVAQMPFKRAITGQNWDNMRLMMLLSDRYPQGSGLLCSWYIVFTSASEEINSRPRHVLIRDWLYFEQSHWSNSDHDAPQRYSIMRHRNTNTNTLMPWPDM